MATCPGCGVPLPDGEDFRYCEHCGYDLATGEPAPTTGQPDQQKPAGRWLTSAGPPLACAGCGDTWFGVEGYCETCGQRRPSGEPHSELDLGVVAGVTDVGKRHHQNEDAMGIGVLPGTLLAVVCDGVSSSTRPDTASHAAVDAATRTLLDELAGGAEPDRAITAAAGAAQAGAALAAGAQPGTNPPSSTFVCATVSADRVTVGWVGDSRAYWLPEGDGTPACLTTDDSLAGRLAAAGVAVAEHPAGPAGALIRWLGADAPDAAPHVVGFAPTGPGLVLVCSDGLFRYRPTAAELAESVRAAPQDSLLAIAQSLVQLALAAGGVDNITAVLLPFPPPDAEGVPS
jgi:serine/threonine protein phosphatase PrpC